eukprot:GHVS01057329.1.p1 GENE.GHVS01057329.1~~GHVS01057329.1.p1  ORF type:complete len:149 (+),score=15.70 GHVS01057329.1:139-585(+)
MASTRRLDRLIIGSSNWASLSRIQRIGITQSHKNNNIVNDFIEWFVPVIRYQNPKIAIDIIPTTQTETSNNLDSSPSSNKLVLTAAGSSTRWPVATTVGTVTTHAVTNSTAVTSQQTHHELRIEAYNSSHHLLHEIMAIDKHLTLTTT